MCCGECEMAVLDAVAQARGVEAAEASARTGVLVIESSLPVDTLDVLDAVKNAGFTARLFLCEHPLSSIDSDSWRSSATDA
ncbi:heavy-metal-associated domain-containing protein [Mycobacterium bourgelatii]